MHTVIKQFFDSIISLLMLVVLSPFLLLVLLIILGVERKTPFFIQTRIGKNKCTFRIYKFRSMDKGMITPVGRVLRRTGIDELPQLLNILKGDMSFVGSRPLTRADINRLEWNTPFYISRWTMQPGIVGLAQLAPVCHKKMSWFYDCSYIKNHTLLLDLKIMMAAVIIPVVGKQKVKRWIHGRA